MKAILILSSFFAASICMAACPQNEICPGDRVMESANRLAKVITVSDQGVAVLKLDGRIFSVNRAVSTLSKKTNCYQNICGGDRVLDGADQMGTVTEVFDNGKAQVAFDAGYSDIRVAVTLGKSVECIEKLCVQQNIKGEGENSGLILELFDSGKVLIKLDNSIFPRVRTFLSLDIQAPCKIKENCTVATTPVQNPKPSQKPPKAGGLRRGH